MQNIDRILCDIDESIVMCQRPPPSTLRRRGPEEVEEFEFNRQPAFKYLNKLYESPALLGLAPPIRAQSARRSSTIPSEESDNSPESVASQLLALSSDLKASAQSINRALSLDQSVLNQVDASMDKSLNSVRNQSSRFEGIVGTNSIFRMMKSLFSTTALWLLILAVWLSTFMMMRVIPKP